MRAVGLAAVWLATMVLAYPAPAKVAPTSLDGLAGESTSIVVGTVTRVVDVVGVRIVILRVDETWKGPEAAELAFVAQPTWICDTTGGASVERGVYFLSPYDYGPDPPPEWHDSSVWGSVHKHPAGFRDGIAALNLTFPLMAVVHSGRGRMPIRSVGADAYATVWAHDVALPQGTPTIEGPDRMHPELLRSVRLEILRGLLEVKGKGE